MRSFQAIVVFLFALVAGVFAAETESYDATVYVTSTVYRVNTVTASSSSPAGYTAANSTSTISATHPTIIPSYNAGNTTASMAMPTASGPMASASASAPPQFEGAASSLQINGLVVALAAGVGYLVL